MVVVSWSLNSFVRLSDIFKGGWQQLTGLDMKDLCDAALVLSLEQSPCAPVERKRGQVRASYNTAPSRADGYPYIALT